jgi:hypothetical protein
MSNVESRKVSRIPQESIREAFQVINSYNNIDEPSVRLYDLCFEAVDILATHGLWSNNLLLFSRSAEKLLNLISQISNPDSNNMFSHSAESVIQSKDILKWEISKYENDKDSILRQELSIALINKVFQKGDKGLQKEIIEIYSETELQIIYHMLTGKCGFDEALANYLQRLPFTKDSIMDSVREITPNISPNRFRPRVKALLSSGNKTVRELGREIARYLLSATGIDGKHVYAKTLETPINKDDNDLREYLAEDIDAIFEMEKKFPGSTEWLRLTRGITHLARYPHELLMDQLIYRDDTTSPWGLVVFPSWDHNGAFYEKYFAFSGLRADIRSEGKYRIRITEGGTLFTLAKRLLAMQKKYGPTSFAVLGGHGNSESISFGDNIKEDLKKSQIENQKSVAKLIKKVFAKETPIVLASCLTGKKGGIAQAISKHDLIVTGPEKSTALMDINVSKENGKLKLKANYSKGKSNTFQNGKLLRQK